MARTFNRRPDYVSGPSSSDIKTYNSNQSTFTGVNESKNYLTVDQNSFADAENMYVDQEGLLRSRPSLKYESVVPEDSTIKVFGDYVVQITTENIQIYKDGDKVFDETLEFVDCKTLVLRNKNYLYVFGNKYYVINLNTYKLEDFALHMYAPIKSETDKSEADNLIFSGKKNVIDGENLTDDILLELKENGSSVTVNINSTEYVMNNVEDFKSRLSFEDYTVSPSLITSPNKISVKYVTNDDGTIDKYYVIITKFNSIRLIKNGVLLADDTFDKTVEFVEICEDGTSVYAVCVDYIYKRYFDVTGQGYGWFRFCNVNVSWLSLSLKAYSETDVLISYRYYYSIRNYLDSYVGSKRVIIHTGLTSSDGKNINFTPNESVNVWSYVSDTYAHHELATMPSLDNNPTRIKGAPILLKKRGSKHYICVFDEEINFYKINFILRNDFTGTVNCMKFIIDTDNSTVNTNVQKNVFVTDISYIGKYADFVTNKPIVLNMSKSFDGVIYFREDGVNSYYDFNYISNDETAKYCYLSSEVDYNNVYEEKEYAIKSPTFDLLNKSNRMTNDTLILNDKSYNLFVNGTPLYLSDGQYAIYTDDGKIYNNLYNTDFTLSYVTDGEIQPIAFEDVDKLDKYYFTKGNTLYISDNRVGTAGGIEKLYIHDYAVTDEPIVNIHKISSSELAVFTENNIYYVMYDTENSVYRLRKSLIPLGCLKESDVITSFDGTRTIFPTIQGLAALTYQNFVATTEQTLSFLTDSIRNRYDELSKKPIKLCQYKYWLLCYNEGSSNCLLFDYRYNAWWPWTLSGNITQIVDVKNELKFVVDKILCNIDKSTNDYKDFNGSINWSIKSQPLHLNAPNYYKTINAMTINTVVDDNEYVNECSYVLKVTNYRKFVNDGASEVLNYKVDDMRVFMKRLHYCKIANFQYELHNDKSSVHQLPFSASTVDIKYGIKGEIR